MWSLDTLKAVTRLCRREARPWRPGPSPAPCGATCSPAAGRVEKRPGLPPKRECLAGVYAPAWTVKGLDGAATSPRPRDCIVIGAGLAGAAAAAASLARRGWRVRVLDIAAGPATGASDLPAGLLAPHQSPDDNLLSRLSRAGVRVTLQEAEQHLARGLEWDRTGVLEWRGDDRGPLPELGGALAVWSREATDAQKRAGGAACGRRMVAQNAAWIEPAALVRLWLREPGVRFAGGRKVARLRRDGQWVLEDARRPPHGRPPGGGGRRPGHVRAAGRAGAAARGARAGDLGAARRGRRLAAALPRRTATATSCRACPWWTATPGSPAPPTAAATRTSRCAARTTPPTWSACAR